MSQQRRDVVTVPWKRGEPGRNAEGSWRFHSEFGESEIADLSLKSMRDLFDRFRGCGMFATRSFGIAKDDHEFVAADPEDVISTANRGPKECHRFAQDLIASFVAIEIVVGFEVVDVEHHQRHDTTFAPRGAEGFEKDSFKGPPIARVGEFVRLAEFLEASDLMI